MCLNNIKEPYVCNAEIAGHSHFGGKSVYYSQSNEITFRRRNVLSSGVFRQYGDAFIRCI